MTKSTVDNDELHVKCIEVVLCDFGRYCFGFVMHFLVNSFTFNWILMVKRNLDSWNSVHDIRRSKDIKHTLTHTHSTSVCIIISTHICMPHTKSAHHQTKGVEQWQGDWRKNKWSIVFYLVKRHTNNDFNWTRHIELKHTQTQFHSYTLSIWHFKEDEKR